MEEQKQVVNKKPADAPPTRKVMLPLILVASAFVVLIGLNAEETRTFAPAGTGGDGLTLTLNDPTPAESVALEADFVPADEARREQVMEDLAELARDWNNTGHKVSVTPMELDDTAVQFVRQLDEWLARYDLGVDHPFSNEDMGEVSHPPQVSGLVIRCRESNRSRAKALGLAISPLVRGNISIRFTERSLPKQLDVFVESAPRFSAAGVAYFPATDVDV